jgi:hypothetical protein
VAVPAVPAVAGPNPKSGVVPGGGGVGDASAFFRSNPYGQTDDKTNHYHVQ